MQTRIQKLEALLQRVRERAGRGTPQRAPTEPPADSGKQPTAAALGVPTPVVPAPLAAPPPVAPPPLAAVQPISVAPVAPSRPPFAAPAPSVPPVAVAPFPPAPSARLEPPPKPSPVEVRDSSWPETEVEVSLPADGDDASVEALGEEDLLEIPSDMLESVPPVAALGLGAEHDEPPASSQRPRAMHALDELSDSPDAMLGDDEREVPLKTPPPESGPQAAPVPAMGAPALPEIENLLESPAAAEAPALSSPFDSLEQPFSSPSRPPPPASGPTVEQLGQTIELEESTGPSLELDRRSPEPSSLPPPDELEAPILPSGGQSGVAIAEQERAPLAVAASSVPSVPPQEHLVTMPAAAAREAGSAAAATQLAMSEAIQRPPLVGAQVVAPTTGLEATARPTTFLELLDASIALGR